MSEERKNYDRHFAPIQSAALDAALDEDEDRAESGCSCHISPPCGYCMSKNEQEVEELWK